MATYNELLEAVDALIAFTDGIKPVVKHRRDGTEYLDLSQGDEARLKAREHIVLTLTDKLGLTDELPRKRGGVFYSKTSMPIWTKKGQEDVFYRRWRREIGRFREVVAELAGSPSEQPPTAESKTPTRKKRRRAPGELNGLAMNMIMSEPEMRGGTCKQWAKYLHCHESQVPGLPAWKELALHRKSLRIQRQKDRHRAGRSPGTK